jgi:hypothetical protein
LLSLPFIFIYYNYNCCGSIGYLFLEVEKAQKDQREQDEFKRKEKFQRDTHECKERMTNVEKHNTTQHGKCMCWLTGLVIFGTISS